MASTFQTTLAHDVRVSGVGVHGGLPANLTLRPAPADTGVVFVRTDLSGDNRVGFGAGNYDGQGAFAVGYQRAFNNNHASVSVGASVSGSETSVGVGGGFSW